MITPQQVKQHIASGLDYTHLEVEGDGQHFYATIVSANFAGKSSIDRHRMVNKVIAPRIASNEIHALSIVRAVTPDEWQKQQG